MHSASDKHTNNIHIYTLGCFPNLVFLFALRNFLLCLLVSLLKKIKVGVTLGHKRPGVNFQITILKCCWQNPVLFNMHFFFLLCRDTSFYSQVYPPFYIQVFRISDIPTLDSSVSYIPSFRSYTSLPEKCSLIITPAVPGCHTAAFPPQAILLV